MSILPFTAHSLWKRREADRARQHQSIGRYPIIDLTDPPRNPDGTRSDWCALLDTPPKREPEEHFR